MSTNDNWLTTLPDPDPSTPTPQQGATAEVDLVDQVLREVTRQVDNKYGTHGIEATSTKTSRLESDQAVVLNYALYLSFPAHNYFSYRLLELVSHVPNGGFPVEVTAFTGPAESLGRATNQAELRQFISQVFAGTRTRWLINSYYLP